MTQKIQDCERCHGTGHIARFGHYAGGLCFACMGNGKQRVRPIISAVDEYPEPPDWEDGTCKHGTPEMQGCDDCQLEWDKEQPFSIRAELIAAGVYGKAT